MADYQVVEVLDEVPGGRRAKPKVDKYEDHRRLLTTLQEGKVHRVMLPRDGYRAFSAAVRSAGIQMEMKVDTVYKGDSVYIWWEPLTAENRPKPRGRAATKSAEVP